MHVRFSLSHFLGKLLLPLFLCQSASAFDQQWLNLLHSEGSSSHLDSPAFFLADNPDSELKASIAEIGSSHRFGKLKLPFECAYPARAKYLQKNYRVVLKETCPDLKAWLEGLNPQSLSLVFASYYPNNPASIFGHTFLKINSSPENKISDYAINYLAITDETNGLMFGLKGLLGFYRGQFNILPYFLKINEYNHSESRDMFEYGLTLNQDEVDTLLRHVWELENNGYFDYYFLDDNCSYFILRLLDVARPSLKLAERFPSYVIPSETMKAVYESGLTSKIQARPSLYTKITEVPGSSEDKKILIQQFKKLTQKKWSPQEEKLYHKLLLDRSKLPQAVEAKWEPKTYPHETHDPLSIGMAIGRLNDSTYTQFTFTPGVHDLLSPQSGYLPFSAVETLKTSIRSFDLNQLFVDRFTLIEIKTLNPHHSWNPKLSWKTKIEYDRFNQNFCESCGSTLANYGFGKTVLIDSVHALSGFLNAQVQVASHFERQWTYGLHPELHYNFASRWNLESSLMLLTRFDEKRVFDSLKFSQGIGLPFGLRLRGDYYAPVESRVPPRSDYQVQWVWFI
jgi:hypothetical protein